MQAVSAQLIIEKLIEGCSSLVDPASPPNEGSMGNFGGGCLNVVPNFSKEFLENGA